MRISPSWQRSAKARSGATIWRCADPSRTPEAQDWWVFRRDHSAESSSRSLIRHLRVESLWLAPSGKRVAGQEAQAQGRAWLCPLSLVLAPAMTFARVAGVNHHRREAPIATLLSKAI